MKLTKIFDLLVSLVGFGLGIYMASEIMKSHNGYVTSNLPPDYEIPDEFQNGAIVNLVFLEK